MSWLSDLFRPQNLLLIGVILGVSGLFVSAIGWYRLTWSGPAWMDELAAKYTELDTRLKEVARLNAEVAAKNSELSALRQQYEDWFNGGDSFCYASATIIARKSAIRSIVHEGKYPLYDVELTITDPLDGSTRPPENVHIGYMAPHSVRVSGRWYLPPDRDEQDYLVHISARNGTCTEKVQFKRVDERWTVSVRVLRDSTGELWTAKTGWRQNKPAPSALSRQRTEGTERVRVQAEATEAAAEGGWNAVEKRLPDFDLEGTDQRKWSLSALEGKTVLIDTWATWCASCIAEHPGVQRLYDRFKDDPDFAVLTFNIDRDPAPVQDYLKKHGYTFPVLFARDLISRIFEVISIPCDWIIDSKGVLRWERIGLDQRIPWEGEAERLLESTRRDTTPKL